MESCGLYVHIPYCTSKCGYCDFYSVAIEGLELDGFMRALERELVARVSAFPHRISTIFVGGGTPTVIPIHYLESLMTALGTIARKHQVLEFTVEANPGTVDGDKLRILTGAGVNRISMGAQSFLESELLWLQRDHSPGEIEPSVRLAREFGIRRLNLDLIFGIGCQTMESWNYSIERALALETDHLSCYGLTYEPGTLMTAMKHKGEVVACDEALEAEMYLHLVDRLAEAGFEQYEISNFAKPGQRCLHNMIYWKNEPYIGVGPSASGYVDGVRYKNVANIRSYAEGIELRGEAVAQSERVTGLALASETIMLQLRLSDGIDVPGFRARFDVDLLEMLSEPLRRMKNDGLLICDARSIRLTRQGSLVADGIITDLAFELDLRMGKPTPAAMSSRSLKVIAS